MKCLVFDVETTGLDENIDRVIELAWMTLHITETSTVSSETARLRFDPQGRKSEPDAFAAHGITDEELVGMAKFSEAVAMGLLPPEFFEPGIVLIGYNGTFDMAMLSTEFSRVGIAWPLQGVLFMDPHKAWGKIDRRSLKDAVVRFCGYEPDAKSLHGAEYDTFLTAQVVTSMAEHERQDHAEFVATHARKVVDPAGKLVEDEDGQVVYSFGKHKGRPVLEEKSYAQWMLSGNFPESTKRALRALLGL